MAGAAKQRKIDELLAKASESLSRESLFEAERMAEKALAMARQEQDFERMIRLVSPLYEARRKRYQSALDYGKVNLLDEPFTEETKIKPGCYLIQPPQVGAEARRLRLAAMSRDIPVAVLCREPVTRSGLVPVVAISPGSTLRAKVDPPDDPDNVDLEWFVAAMESLGDFALETIDPGMIITRRLDAIMDYLDALPEHKNLHEALEAACRVAHDERTAQKAAAATKAAAKTKLKTTTVVSEAADEDG